MIRLQFIAGFVVLLPACSCVPGGDGDAGVDDSPSDVADDEEDPIVDLSGNGVNFCAHRARGGWGCWGSFRENGADLTLLPMLVDEAAPGVGAACVVMDGIVSCVGQSTIPRNPIEVPPRVPMHGVAPNVFNACAIDAALDLRCWGQPAGTYPELAGVLEVRASGSNHYCARTATDIVCFVPGTTDLELSVGLPASRLAGQGESVRCWLSLEGRPRCETRCMSAEIGRPEDCVYTEWDSEVGPLPDVELLQLEIIDAYLACGIHVDHTLECWGSTYHRRFGDRPSLAETTPVGELWRDIAIGNGICGITLDGRLLCWGSTAPGEVPDI